MQSERVLVTGAAGFIGSPFSHAAGGFLAAGFSVEPPDYRGPLLEFVPPVG